MAAVRPDIEKIWDITLKLEAMYREWNALEDREWTRAMVPTQAFPRCSSATWTWSAASTTRR